MHHVSVVVGDLEAAKAFFAALGLELEGETPIEGEWVDRINALDGIRVGHRDDAHPDGHGRLELTKFHSPAAVSEGPQPPPSNTLGCAASCSRSTTSTPPSRRCWPSGGELIGEVVRYEDVYRLCYVRGPEGIIVALSEDLRRRAGRVVA